MDNEIFINNHKNKLTLSVIGLGTDSLCELQRKRGNILVDRYPESICNRGD